MDRQDKALSIFENQWSHWKSIPSVPPEALGGVPGGTDHFGIFGEDLDDTQQTKSDACSLANLSLVSSVFHDLFNPLLVRTVILRTGHLPSFLLLLKNRPGIGHHIRDLRFNYLRFEERVSFHPQIIANNLIKVDHPKLIRNSGEKFNLLDETSKADEGLALEILHLSRSIIISECKCLETLVFNSGLGGFPFVLPTCLDQSLTPIFSKNIKRFLMIENSQTREQNNLNLSGRQLFFLLHYLKDLKYGSFEISFDQQDALMFRDCLDELMEKNLFGSKVEYLHLNIGPTFTNQRLKGGKMKFDSTEIFTKFFSIFKSLKNFSVEFKLPEDSLPIPPEALPSHKIELPEFPILKGLKACISTLESFSLIGMTDLNIQKHPSLSLQIASSAISSILPFKNLKHFRLDSPFMVQLILGSKNMDISNPGSTRGSADQKSILPESLETLDLAGNFEISNVSGEFRPLELSLAHIVREMRLPKNLKVVRSYDMPRATYNSLLGRNPAQFDPMEFMEGRDVLVEAFEERQELRLELIKDDYIPSIYEDDEEEEEEEEEEIGKSFF